MGTALKTRESLRIERQAGELGAYVHGVDLSQQLSSAVKEQLQSAVLEHLVIGIRGQNISPEDQIRFAEIFGEIFVHPYVKGIEGHPKVLAIHRPNSGTEVWHSDTTHSECPPRYTVLAARILPQYGGDTMFASQYAAYERLSPAMQKMLGGLRAVHRDYSIAAGLAVGQYERLTDNPYDSEFVHPVVRTHPETGRKALYVNAKNVQRFEGMTEEESRPLLDYLFAHCSRAEISWRHHWQAGDVLIWDNACVQHAVVGDVPKGMDRTMHRITICGETVV